MEKNYDPKVEEPKWQKFWEDNKIYSCDPKKASYSIDTPPPTVSGRMHIGHAFSYTQGDFVARYHRMRNRNVFYPFGTDDNGLPTERLVEKLKKVKSTRMDRQEFIDLCNETLKEIKPEFVSDWQRLGMSCDFTNSYSTIDPSSIAISQHSFIDLFEKGLLFREDTPVAWSTTSQTAVAQAEFENVEMMSHFNDIVFKVGGKDVIIATTRPELLGACVAVFYHPDDKRYEEFEGKFAKVPLFDYEVPIIADATVDKDKGTGIVMCCTFGDKTDIEWWRKYNLPLKTIIGKDGKITNDCKEYEGFNVKDARKKIIEDLKAKNLLVRQQEIMHNVNVYERDGTEIEFLKTPQWYIRILDNKEKLVEAGKKITWYPEHMKTRYIHWVENLNWDWCISRQRHFGVPFPVWYEKDTGKIIVADKAQLPVDPLKDMPKNYQGDVSNLIPEKDVMDTWATSSVTPQIALKWESDQFDLNFPMDVRLQAHDIIRTWAFYTIVKSFYMHDDIPWNNIMISGHAQDPKGRKMSKSRGNVVDPNIMIEKYCADALRFWSSTSKLGDDLPFQEKDLVTGGKMMTKLWNASRFVLMHLEDYELTQPNLVPMDLWILHKLQLLVKDCTENFEKYEYSKTRLETEKFFWKVFCDNYLEIVKDRIYNPDTRGADARLSAQFTLYHVLLTVLKLCAPIMPHVTESLYQNYFSQKEGCTSIHISPWPEYNEDLLNYDAYEAGELAVDIIATVRKFKSENNVSMKADVSRLVIECDAAVRKNLELVLDDICSTLNVKDLLFGSGDLRVNDKISVEISLDL